MKKFVAFLFLSSIFSFAGVNAQERSDRNHNQRIAEMRAKQIAYISEHVVLTPQEAEKFWPLYEEYRDKRMYLLREYRKEIKKFSQLELPGDKDYKRIVEGDIEVKLGEARLTKEYYSLFEKILSPKKLYDFMRAEEAFTREFLKRLPPQ